MEQETKDREHASGVELTITSVEVLTDQRNPNEVTKVLFETSKGRVSFKPKSDKETFQDGLKIKTKQPCKIEELPQIIKDIGKNIAQKGNVLVNASYNIWHTEQDNEPVTYRFVQGNKMIDSWIIVGNKEEKIA